MILRFKARAGREWSYLAIGTEAEVYALGDPTDAREIPLDTMAYIFDQLMREHWEHVDDVQRGNALPF